jgi:small subunit ribosomal protein S6
MAAEKYEAMIVFSTRGGEESVNALKEKFSALIQENGNLLETKEWGKRILRYNILKQNEGFYVIYHFTAPPAFPQEFQRVAGITEGVLRSLVTAWVEPKPLPEKPVPAEAVVAATPTPAAERPAAQE